MKSRPESINDNTTKSPLPQGQSITVTGHITESISNEAKTAMEELQRAVNQSNTFLMLTTESVSVSIDCFQPKENDDFPQWPKFVDLCIHSGVPTLVIDQVSRLRFAVSEWRLEQLTLIQGEKRHEPTANLDQEIYSLNCLSHFLAGIITSYYPGESVSTGPLLLAWRLTNALHDAYSKSLACRKKLLDAIEGPVESQRAA